MEGALRGLSQAGARLAAHGGAGDYREFFRLFYTPAIDYVVVAQTFATRAEADVWLGGSDAREGDLIRIADQGFQVMLMRKGPGLRFVRMGLIR